MPLSTLNPPGAFPRLRSQFPILETSTYLISNSLGAMPRGAEEGLQRYADEWRTRGVRAWHEGWWEQPIEIGDLVAPILGVGTGSVSMHHNVTVAAAIFLSCFDYPTERNRIVYTEHNFHTLRYLLDGERRKGAEIHVVPSRDGIGIELQDLLDAIDERTRLVPISHVLFRSAFVQDAEAIAARCREVGAVLLLDVYQSAGILPLDLERWGVDAAVGGCLKWLCGGPGNAFLYVRPGLDGELVPALTGWQSDEEPFAFRGAPHRRVASGAMRFLTGTPNVPAHYAARAGLELLATVDAQELRRYSLELTQRILDAATDAGFGIHSPTDPARRGGTVTVAHSESQRLSEGLLARDILCDHRPGAGIRFSPHVYSTAEECDRAITALRELRDAL